MKKYVKYISILIFAILLLYSNKANASSSATVFIGEPIILDSYENIEITYNNVEINEETSQIKNTQIYTNLSDKVITRKASIKLEDTYSNLTINSLKILVNDLEIKEITKSGDNYIFYFQIQPNEGKKIEISYITDSNLQDTKIIKYTMDKLKGKNIKLFDIKIILSKYDIPLVQKIWPGAYEFEGNNVSTEYVDFTVNNLTSTVIMQKDTYRNIKYGEYSDNLSDIDEYILEHYKEFIDGNVPTIPYKSYSNSTDIITKWMNRKEYKYWAGDRINEALKTVIDYVLVTKANSENKIYYTNEYGDLSTTLYFHCSDNYCLAKYINTLYTKDYIYGQYNEKSAVGKMVAINYYETEEGKDLYVNKDINNSKHAVEGAKFVLTKRDEHSILRTQVSGGAGLSNYNEGIRRVFVNSDIDGNKIDITEEEIIDFVNMMNIDLYLRFVVHDIVAKPSSIFENVICAYYTNDTKEIADSYANVQPQIKYYKDLIEDHRKNIGNIEYFGEYTEERFSEDKERFEGYIEEIKKSIKKFDNEIVVKYSKVPTLAHCVATCRYENEKYLIDFNGTGDESGLGYIYGATECDTAKKLLAMNKDNNDTKRNQIVTKINSLKITEDTEEYIPKVKDENIEETKDNTVIGLDRQDIIILSSIFGTIILLIIILIIILIKNKRRK